MCKQQSDHFLPDFVQQKLESLMSIISGRNDDHNTKAIVLLWGRKKAFHLTFSGITFFPLGYRIVQKIISVKQTFMILTHFVQQDNLHILTPPYDFLK